MYEFGRGVPQSFTEAAAWYRKAADQDYAIAQNNLGYLYRDGHGVPQSESEAAAWFEKAARNPNR
jgi:TPR repeat protein